MLANDPCLATIFDGNPYECLLCAPGSARIMIEAPYLGYIYREMICGSIRKPKRNENDIYEYLDIASATQDDYASEEYQCFVSPFYDGFYDIDLSKLLLYPRVYVNHTTGISEVLCAEKEKFIQKSCQHGFAPGQEYINSLTSIFDAIQLSVIPFTLGCNHCSSYEIPIIAYD